MYAYVRPEITPPLTFGLLRRRHLGFTVRCLRCRHDKRFSHKESRYLRSRLPDALELAHASELFRCTKCQGNSSWLMAEQRSEKIGVPTTVSESDSLSTA